MKHTDEEIEAAARQFEDWAGNVDPATVRFERTDRETAYLMSSPLNARRLLASIDELENGGGTVRDLVEP